MASKIKVDQIEGSTGSSITIPSGQTLTITDGLAASTIGSGTLADARIPNLNASKINAGTIPVARGGTGLTSLGSAGQIVQVNSGGSALEFAAASSGKTLVVPTRIAHDDSQVSASSGGTALPSTGTAKFYYPIGAKLSGSFTKTSATSVIGIAVQYCIENNGTNQHDTYLWAGTGATLGSAGDNFRYHIGDDGNRQHNDQQFTGRTIYITGMSTGSHTFAMAAGTFGDRTHTFYYCPSQQHGDRSAAVSPSTMWVWETEV
mgnify:CR=1 FL=1